MRRPGNATWPPPGSITPVAATASRCSSTWGVPNPEPRATTWSGRRRCSEASRGSPPGSTARSAPEARAVVTAASWAAGSRASTSTDGRRAGATTGDSAASSVTILAATSAAVAQRDGLLAHGEHGRGAEPGQLGPYVGGVLLGRGQQQGRPDPLRHGAGRSRPGRIRGRGEHRDGRAGEECRAGGDGQRGRTVGAEHRGRRRRAPRRERSAEPAEQQECRRGPAGRPRGLQRHTPPVGHGGTAKPPTRNVLPVPPPHAQ